LPEWSGRWTTASAGSAGGFTLPAQGGPLRIAFTACNGYEDERTGSVSPGRNRLWRKLAAEHARASFHLLLHGGDQLYADSVCAGEYVVGKAESASIDQWAAATQNRCGTFDFSSRAALLEMINANGFFDMGSLPNFQQAARVKTVPFINSHDTWRGPFHDSNAGSELFPTIDPDDREPTSPTPPRSRSSAARWSITRI
jgi:hypothetical protein